MSPRMHDNSALIAQSVEELVNNPVDSAAMESFNEVFRFIGEGRSGNESRVRSNRDEASFRHRHADRPDDRRTLRAERHVHRGQVFLRVHRVSRAIGIEVGKIYRAQNHTKLARETFVSDGVGLLMGMLSAQFVNSSSMSKACITYGASCRSRRWSVATPTRFFVLQRSFLLRWLCLPLRIISSTSIGLDAKGVNKQDRTRSRRAEPWSIVRRIYPAARPQ